MLDQYCNEVTEKYEDFTITWSRTQVGATVTASCTGAGLDGQLKLTVTTKSTYVYAYMCYVGVVSRRCIGNDEWEEIIGCFNEEAEDLLNQVMSISLLHV